MEISEYITVFIVVVFNLIIKLDLKIKRTK